jgi:hypothetical protein
LPSTTAIALVDRKKSQAPQLGCAAARLDSCTREEVAYGPECENHRYFRKPREHDQAKVQVRFELAQKAIATFHTGVSPDTLLKNDQFKELRTKLLKEEAGFYTDLEKLPPARPTPSRGRRWRRGISNSPS